MGRKVRSEEGGVASSSSSSKIGAEGQFLVRAYETTSGRERNEYVSKGTSEDPYVVIFEVGQAAAVYFYDYAAYSDDANNSVQTISRSIVTDAAVDGITMTNSTDYMLFNGTPTTEGEHLYSWTIYNIDASAKFDDGSKRQRTVYFKAIVLPSGALPVWTDSTTLKTTIVRNESDYTVVSAPSTQSSYAGVRYSITGTYPSFLTLNSATGRLYASATPNLVETEYTDYEFTITAVISDDKVTVSRTYTAQFKVGDPFDAVYFGPGNLKVNTNAYDGAENSTNYLTTTQMQALWNPEIKAGALRRRTNSRYSTSPYRYNEDYGLTYNESWGFSSGSTGYLGPKCSSNTNIASNGFVVKFYWTVPSGVTEFSVVAVGAGAGGCYTWANNGGGAGGLAWVNEVTCTPGEVFEIAVGIGRRSPSSNGTYWAGSTWMRRVEDAGFGANEFIVIGYGGGRQASHVAPLNGRSNPQSSNLYFIQNYNSNNQQDSGCAAASTQYGTYGAYYGGYAGGYCGGGAAGYQGHGGQANGSNGSGGSGGAGQYQSSTYGNSAGGGVGLDGQGSGGNDMNGSGYGGSNGSWSTNYETDGTNAFYYGGGGGSGGSRGCYGQNPQSGSSGIENRYINGGMHGGGGGGSGTSTGGGAGGMGGIRIIWGVAADGTKRAFPATYTTEDPTIADSMNVDGL